MGPLQRNWGRGDATRSGIGERAKGGQLQPTLRRVSLPRVAVQAPGGPLKVRDTSHIHSAIIHL